MAKRILRTVVLIVIVQGDWVSFLTMKLLLVLKITTERLEVWLKPTEDMTGMKDFTLQITREYYDVLKL